MMLIIHLPTLCFGQNLFLIQKYSYIRLCRIIAIGIGQVENSNNDRNNFSHRQNKNALNKVCSAVNYFFKLDHCAP